MSGGQNRHRIHHDAIVRQVAAILDLGRPTRFAYEAACRHGLRLGRIKGGQGWQAADEFAALVVKLALARLGVCRPTWAEGQPEAIDVERYQCAGCGGPLDLGTRLPWCSEECRAIVRARRLRGVGEENLALAQAARAARAKGIEPVRGCLWCNKPFVVDKTNPAQLYCSFECSRSAQKIERPLKTCENCGTQFQPRTITEDGNRKFCSRECYAAGARKNRVARTCPRCGSQFFPRAPSDPKVFCSARCSARARFRCEAA